MEKIKINVELIVKSLILNESLKNKHAGTTKILIINRFKLKAYSITGELIT